MIWHPKTIPLVLWGIGFALADQVFYLLYVALPWWLSALAALVINLVFVGLVLLLLLGVRCLDYFVWHRRRQLAEQAVLQFYLAKYFVRAWRRHGFRNARQMRREHKYYF